MISILLAQLSPLIHAPVITKKKKEKEKEKKQTCFCLCDLKVTLICLDSLFY